MRKLGIALSILVGLPIVLVPQAAVASTPPFAQQTLPANDGWAASGTGTTGGSGGTVTTVRNRDELAAAVAGDSAEDRSSRRRHRQARSARASPTRSTPWRRTWPPTTRRSWGRAANPSGPLEEARVRSVAKQQGDQTEIKVGANTTIFGLRGAR